MKKKKKISFWGLGNGGIVGKLCDRSQQHDQSWSCNRSLLVRHPSSSSAHAHYCSPYSSSSPSSVQLALQRCSPQFVSLDSLLLLLLPLLELFLCSAQLAPLQVPLPLFSSALLRLRSRSACCCPC